MLDDQLSKKQIATLQTIYKKASQGTLSISTAQSAINTLIGNSIPSDRMVEAAAQIAARVGIDSRIPVAFEMLEKTPYSLPALKAYLTALTEAAAPEKRAALAMNAWDIVAQNDNDMIGAIKQYARKELIALPAEEMVKAMVLAHHNHADRSASEKHAFFCDMVNASFTRIKNIEDADIRLDNMVRLDSFIEYAGAISPPHTALELLDSIEASVRSEDAQQQFARSYAILKNYDNLSRRLHRNLGFSAFRAIDAMKGAEETYEAIQAICQLNALRTKENGHLLDDVSIKKCFRDLIDRLPRDRKYIAGAQSSALFPKDHSFTFDMVEKAITGLDSLDADSKFASVVTLWHTARDNINDYISKNHNPRFTSTIEQGGEMQLETLERLLVDLLPLQPKEQHYGEAVFMLNLSKKYREELLDIALGGIDALPEEERISSARELHGLTHRHEKSYDDIEKKIDALQLTAPISTLDGFIGRMKNLPQPQPPQM